MRLQSKSYRKLDISDINLTIFYGQVFDVTGQDLEKSECLRKLIQQNRVVEYQGSDVLDSEIANQHLETKIDTSDSTKKEDPTEVVVGKHEQKLNADLDTDIEHNQSFSQETSRPANFIDPSEVDALRERLLEVEEELRKSKEALAKKPPQGGLSVTVGSEPPAVRQNNDRLDGEEHSSLRGQDVFVPSLMVSDMSNNLNLEVKVIGRGGRLNEAAAALKQSRKV